MELSHGVKLHYSEKEEQLSLLSQVLAAGDEDNMLESLGDLDGDLDMSKLTLNNGNLSTIMNSGTGDMATLTGCAGIVYRESNGASLKRTIESMNEQSEKRRKMEKSVKLSEKSRKLKNLILK